MLRKYFVMGCAMVGFIGCQSTDEPSEPTALVDTDLTLSLSASQPLTRMGDDVVQDGTARNVQLLNISPFSKRGAVTADDRPSYYEVTGGGAFYDRTALKAKFYYRDHFLLTPGVASFLVYGKAAPAASGKAVNGSLLNVVAGNEVASLPTLVVPADLQFKLEPICRSTDISDEAQCLADYLTYIADAYGSLNGQTKRWEEADNTWLQALFLNFTNKGLLPLAGSARNVKAFVNELYRVMKGNTFAEGTMEKKIAEEIMARIAGTSIPDGGYAKGSTTLTITFDAEAGKVESLGSCDGYPGDLPDGAAVLQWTETSGGKAFVPQTVTTTMSNINTITRYAYPAELYYFSNSRIKTNNEEVGSGNYSSDKTWEQIKALYDYDNSVITTNTQAAVIKEPLQYGVARLQTMVEATAAELRDANGETVTVGETSFPIKGIIIGGQRPVGFDFKSAYGPTDESKDNELRFVYDSQVSTNTGGTPYYLSTAEQGPLNTLVLQNMDDEDVTVILELENNSGRPFKGQNGDVYPGTRFYLVGVIEKSKAIDDGGGSEDFKKRVFTQDHITEIHLKVASLATAYNVLPNILTGRLELGVEITLNWQQATPTTVILE